MSTNIDLEKACGMRETFSRLITAREAALYESLIGGAHRGPEDTSPADTHGEDQHWVDPQLLVGMITGLIHEHFSNSGSQCISVQFEFLAPVHSGDQIKTVIEMAECDAARHLVTFKADCYNQRQNQVLTGQAIMLAPA